MLMFYLDDRRLMEEKHQAQKAGKVLARDELDWDRSDTIRRWKARQERRLIIAAQNGNRDAFCELLKPYWKKLEALCYYQVNRQREEAEDLMQDALLKAWDKRNTPDLDKKFWPWIRRITVNTYIDRTRREKREVNQLGGEILSLEEPIVGDGDDEEGGITRMEQLPDKSLDPAEEVILRETFKKCWAALTLDERMSLVFIYRWDGTFKDLGWQKGSMKIESGDDEETIKRKRQSAHQNGRYHVKIALRNLQESLRSEGLSDLAHSQVLQQLQLLEEQETEGGTIQ